VRPDMRKPAEPADLEKPEHWRKRAAETRELAKGEPAEVQAKLLAIATAYDEMAKRSEKRRAGR
jgi:hypothetical protein